MAIPIDTRNPNLPGYPNQPGYVPGQPGYANPAYPNQPGYPNQPLNKADELVRRARTVGLPDNANEADVKLFESRLPNAKVNIGIEGTLSDIQKRAVAANLDYNASEGQILTAESLKGINSTPSIDYRRTNLGLAQTVSEDDVLLAEKVRGINYSGNNPKQTNLVK